MEKFFVTQITKTKESDTYAVAVTVKEDLQSAKMLYHQILASVYATADIDHAIVKVDNYYGNTILIETIIPAPEIVPSEPEPELEPEE